MIVSDDPKFICFQPWKCGSATLYRRLGKYDTGRYPQFPYFNGILGKESHKHISLEDFSKLPESQQSYPRFTFVRNPYDRLYSGFLQRSQKLGSLSKAQMAVPERQEELSAIANGFSAFAKYFMKTGTEQKAISNSVFLQGKPAVDYVGFVDTFDASFVEICRRVGLTDTDHGNANVRFEGGTRHPDMPDANAKYRYIDKFDSETIKAVNMTYPDDFTKLGYRMLQAINFNETGKLRDSALSPFDDVDIPQRQGPILMFKR